MTLLETKRKLMRKHDLELFDLREAEALNLRINALTVRMKLMSLFGINTERINFQLLELKNKLDRDLNNLVR